jgi:hypothetical protein
MKDNIQFNPSAFKHGFTEADIRKTIKTKIYEGQLEDFINKYTIIGFDTVGNLLEILYNIIDSESINFGKKPFKVFSYINEKECL